jgi:hypothetical protein
MSLRLRESFVARPAAIQVNAACIVGVGRCKFMLARPVVLLCADRPLDTGVIATAKARQPPLPLPPSRLPMLPLKEHRLPDVQGGGLMCADPDAVSA